MFTYDKIGKTMVLKEQCSALKAECCRSEKWPEVMVAMMIDE